MIEQFLRHAALTVRQDRHYPQKRGEGLDRSRQDGQRSETCNGSAARTSLSWRAELQPKVVHSILRSRPNEAKNSFTINCMFPPHVETGWSPRRVAMLDVMSRTAGDSRHLPWSGCQADGQRGEVSLIATQQQWPWGLTYVNERTTPERPSRSTTLGSGLPPSHEPRNIQWSRNCREYGARCVLF